MDGRLLLILCLGLLQFVIAQNVNGNNVHKKENSEDASPAELVRELQRIVDKQNNLKTRMQNEDDLIENINKMRGSNEAQIEILEMKEQTKKTQLEIDNLRKNIAYLDREIEGIRQKSRTEETELERQNNVATSKLAEATNVCIIRFDQQANGFKRLDKTEVTALEMVVSHCHGVQDAILCKIHDKDLAGCDYAANVHKDLVEMKTNDFCDDGCVERVIEYQVKFQKICDLKFDYEESSSTVKFHGTAIGADYRKVREYKGKNFFDSLGFGEETTSKMMHSVLKSNICLWRLSYELDENKEIHFDDYGNRLTEYQYRKKIDDCIFDNITQTVTCRIADKPCEANSIQEFKLTSVDNSGTDAAELINMTAKLVRARNRMGPCIANMKETDCKIKEIDFYNYLSFFSSKVFCSNVTKVNSLDCWATNEQIRSEQILEAVTSFDADSYGCNWEDSSKENLRTMINKLSNGCISTTDGIFCVVPQKGECNPNYFANGKGLDSVMILPRMSTCSKKSLRHSFEEMWSNDDVGEEDPHWVLATTEIPTTTDRYAFINSVDSSKSKYAPAHVEFFDPPTKEEISKRRKANEKLAEEKQKLKAAMRIIIDT